MKLLAGRWYVPDSGDVYDTFGRHYIERSLWNQRLIEGRSPYANHRFQKGEAVEEPGIPAQWHRVHAHCTRCGEDRLVYHLVESDTLNRGWCIPAWRRWLDALTRRDSRS